MKHSFSILFAGIALSVSGLALADGHGHSDDKQNKAMTTSSLEQVLSMQADEAQARYQYRNPKETLEFFGIQPGMTVLEALPGGGWYSKILLPYLGKDGALIGADYAIDMWPKFGFFSAEAIEKKKTWVQDWTAQASEWRGDAGANITAFQFNQLPESMHGTADAALFIRATHNLARFESDGGYLSGALKETFLVLKPGGIVGVVQHEARADRPDAWADGSSGYLKKANVIKQFQAAGFELLEESDINENPKDQAVEGDFVWRLPPSLNGTKDDADKRAAMEAIGESHRMTLKFRKPK